MRKKLSLKYFFESILFIVKRSHNAITNPENAKTRRKIIFKSF